MDQQPSAPARKNICTECANADSWGLPDKPCCGLCSVGSEWQPLNKSSVNQNLITTQARRNTPAENVLKATEGSGSAARLRAMATNYPAGHSWDKLDAKACIVGALEIEALRERVANLEEAHADHLRLVRELDVLLNTETGAAKQASLCDIVAQVKGWGLRIGSAIAKATTWKPEAGVAEAIGQIKPDGEWRGFAAECAGQYGAEYLDDDATMLVITEENLVNMMGVIGYNNPPGKANSADELARDLKKATETATELRQQLTLMEEQKRGEIWRWQADGADNLATMGNRMGVLIYASDLRGLLAQAVSPAQPAPEPAPAEQRNTKTHDLLSTMIGLFLGNKEKIGYKPGSVIDKVVGEAVEHLKDWPYPEPAPAQDRELPEAVIDAVSAALGEAYDCTRTWSAWSYGTMSQDDFSMVAEDGDRVAEIARAAIDADRAARAPVAPAGLVLVGYINRGIEYHTKGKTVFHEEPTKNLEARWWTPDEPVYTLSK